MLFNQKGYLEYVKNSYDNNKKKNDPINMDNGHSGILLLHTYWDGYYQKKKNKEQVLERMWINWKLESFCIAGRNVNDAAPVESSLAILQKVKHRTTV